MHLLLEFLWQGYLLKSDFLKNLNILWNISIPSIKKPYQTNSISTKCFFQFSQFMCHSVILKSHFAFCFQHHSLGIRDCSMKLKSSEGFEASTFVQTFLCWEWHYLEKRCVNYKFPQFHKLYNFPIWIIKDPSTDFCRYLFS